LSLILFQSTKSQNEKQLKGLSEIQAALFVNYLTTKSINKGL